MRHDTPAWGCSVHAARAHRLGPTLAVIYACTRNHCRIGRVKTVHTKGKAKMSEAKRIKYVSFRLTDEEYTEIERAAVAAGDDPNNWCRNLALTGSREGPLFGKTGRLIYTELAILRFLVGHGFKLLFSRNAAEATAWTKLTTQADQ